MTKYKHRTVWAEFPAADLATKPAGNVPVTVTVITSAYKVAEALRQFGRYDHDDPWFSFDSVRIELEVRVRSVMQHNPREGFYLDGVPDEDMDRINAVFGTAKIRLKTNNALVEGFRA